MNIAMSPTIKARPAMPIATPMPAFAPVLRPLSLLLSPLLFWGALEVSDPVVADTPAPLEVPNGDGLKSPLVMAAVLLVVVDSFDAMAFEPDVTMFEPDGVVDARPGLEFVLVTLFVLTALVGVVAVLAAELPVITFQSPGETAENVASVTVPLHPPSPQHIHFWSESSYWI
jgi:hypothetical protein